MTEKLRVYQLAKELNVSSREVIWALSQLRIEVRNHMSTIDPELVDRIKEQLRIPVEKPAAPVREGVKKEGEEAPKPKAVRERMKAPVPRDARELEAGIPPVEEGAVRFPPEKEPEVEEVLPEEEGPGEKIQRPEVDEKREIHFRQPRRRRGLDFDALGKEKEKKIVIEGPVTVGNLAQKLGVRPSEAIKRLMSLGVMAGVNQEIEPDIASIVATDFGFQVEEHKVDSDEDELSLRIEDDPSALKPRWPAGTAMGHVDHGKTSLLDAIRRTNVTASEAGGITQHIGASTVDVGEKKIVFLDTPGHEAFTAMRARGAQVTDIAVLVVAADDGVMPQTIEAINHARAAGVPIIVALNKIDKPNANPERVKNQLAEQGLVSEEWGGETIVVEVSAKQKTGINELLDMILLVAEMQELKANPDRPAEGTIIEAQLDKGRGPLATVVVQKGTLKVGDPFVAGIRYGKVRAMFSDKGQLLKKAGPSMPAEVLGFSDVPEAGDRLVVVADERKAREIAAKRQGRRRKQEMELSGKLRLNRLVQRFKEEDLKELCLIIKADVQGSVEAVRQALEKLESDKVHINVIHSGVGAVTESDVMLAAASDAVIVGFNVRPDGNARKAAESEGVEIRAYRIIYEAIEDIEKLMKGMLEPVKVERAGGRAEVRMVFKVPKVGLVAGCYVLEGRLENRSKVRLVRDGKVVYDGRIASLRRFKDDVREVASGYECGVGLEDYSDIKEGDILETYSIEEVSPEAG